MRYTEENEDEVIRWMGGDPAEGEPSGFLVIETLEGAMEAKPGDWIIRGVGGELYPCKPSIFAATYDPVPKGDTKATR